MTDTYLTISEIAAQHGVLPAGDGVRLPAGRAGPAELDARPPLAGRRHTDLRRIGGLVAGRNPGSDPDGWAALPEVISDGMILAAVQPLILGATPDTIPDAASTRQERLDYLHAVGVHGVDALSDDELLDLIRDLADTP